MDINTLKLQWGGSIPFSPLQTSAPELNIIASQNASLNKIKPNISFGDIARSAKDFIFKTTGLSDASGNINPMNIAGGTMDLLSNLKFFQKDYSGKRGNITKGIDQGFKTASNMLISSGNPLGMAAGAIIKGADLLGTGLEKIGVGTDKMATADAIMGSTVLNLSPVSIINNAFGKKTDTIDIDQEAVNNSSYTGTGEDIEDAGMYSNKKYGLLSNRARKKANKKIKQAKTWQSGIQDILGDAKDARAIQASSTDMFNNRSQLQQSGILGNRNIAFGKRGMKFILEYREYVKNKENDKNLLPVGALHARKHNLTGIEGVQTTKGIPVLLEQGGKTVAQLAEIEKNEIIFRKSVTDKLEELFEEGTDEAAIEAGKLLVREILYNTKDEGEFIKTVE